MAHWLQMLLGCTLSMDAVTCLMVILAPLLSRRYSQRTVYGLLTVVLMGFLIPWRPVLPHPAVQIPLPVSEPEQIMPYVTDWQDGELVGKIREWNVRFSAPYEQQPYHYQVSVSTETGEADQFFAPREIYRTQVDWQENHNGNG